MIKKEPAGISGGFFLYEHDTWSCFPVAAQYER